MNRMVSLDAPSASVGEVGRATLGHTLEPDRLLSFAGELDAAGEACMVMARRTNNHRSKVRHLARASACYGAASLLRKIAD